MSSLTNGDNADDFFFQNASGDNETWQGEQKSLPFGGSSGSSYVAHHDKGITPAYTLKWAEDSKTVVSGGGKLYSGDFRFDKTIDFVISAVSLDVAHVAIGKGLSCQDFGTVHGVERMVLLDWPDMQTPNLSSAFWKALAQDITEIKPEHLHVQCAGGNGRTGTTLAILLQLLSGGYPTVEALVTSLRAGYRKAAVESRSQLEYIGAICNIPNGDIAKLVRKTAPPPATKTAKAKPAKIIGGDSNSSGTGGFKGTTTVSKLSPEDEATRTSPGFLDFDSKWTTSVPLEVAIAYYNIWTALGKPHVIKKGSIPFVVEVAVADVHPDHHKIYNKNADGTKFLQVSFSHIYPNTSGK